MQLRINDANRELDQGLKAGASELGLILARVDQMQGVLVDRNLQGQELEKQGKVEAATALYEANVADMFDGSHPYERLMVIYTRQGAQEDAGRVARACLAQCTAGMSEKVRARCLKVLGSDARPS